LVIVLPSSKSAYSFIIDVEVYAGQLFALAIAVGLVLLRKEEPHILRPFRAWLPLVWLRVVFCVGLIVAPFFPPRDGLSDVDFFYASYAIVAISV
jgi:amino acid transporter